MRYFVRIGTTELRLAKTGSPPRGFVVYEGEVPTDIRGIPKLVWDDALNNVRPLNSTEESDRDSIPTRVANLSNDAWVTYTRTKEL